MYFIILYFLSAIVIQNLAKECGSLDLLKNDSISWITNIYQLSESGGHHFICTGTMVSPSLILTAASCLYDDKTKQLRHEKFYVVMGQKHKNWKTQNSLMQIREINSTNLEKLKTYTGHSGKYANNIVIIKLNEDQKIPTFQPACVYWDNDFGETNFEMDPPTLKIIAWPIGSNTSYNVIEPSYVDFDECQNFLTSRKVRQFLTYDKLCAKTKDMNAVPSIGSGVYALDKNKNRWFLIGITSEVTAGDSSIYITYAKMHAHLNWISNTAFLHI